jgi:predicted nucleic acid-binding protein
MTQDPAILQAIIGALGTVIAALVGVLTWYLTSRSERLSSEEEKREERRREEEERREERRKEEERREQRVLDLVVALHSEIVAGTVANQRQLTADQLYYAMAQKSPFATPDETDFVFDSVKGDISILPVGTIHSVVQHYRTAQQSNLLTRDLRDPVFQTQTDAEKRKFIAELLRIVELQRMFGKAALEDLAAYAAEYGLDLPEKERRAEDIFRQARAEFAQILKQSERSGPSSKPPSGARDVKRRRR